VSEQPFLLTPDGQHGLCWWRDDLPLEVYLGEGCTHLMDVLMEAFAYWEQEAGVQLFRWPVDAIPPMLTAFADPPTRAGLTRAVLIQGTGEDENHGDTDLRHDDRDGHIRSALVTLPRTVGPYLGTVVRHEIGHVLGLAHWHEGMMVPRPESPTEVPVVAAAQRDALRRVYA
jgi:hypothetical protein